MTTIRFASAFVLMTALAACSDSTDNTVTPDGGSGDGGGGGSACTAAREQTLKPVATVSTGEVKTLSDAGGVKTIFVDASAGGAQAAATNPRVYLSLETATRVDVSDVDAATSTAWDLAVKRPVLFANSGDGGSGQGGAVLVAKPFDAVTAADGAAATFTPESFFDADCKAKVDQTGAVKTSFDGWYDYDQATNHLTPKTSTWIVKGGTGKLFKVQITSYYANPDGTEGMAGGRYTLKIGAL